MQHLFIFYKIIFNIDKYFKTVIFFKNTNLTTFQYKFINFDFINN